MIDNYFDKAYVITIKKNKDRHEYIKNLFKKMNINNYEFIYGIEGNKINVEQLEKEGLIHSRINKYPNIIGTILTHKDAWIDMINNNYKQCVFFEDDVYFLEEYEKNFNNFMENLPYDWSVLQFGWLPPYHRSKEGIKVNNYVMRNWSAVGGAHFYALNLNSVKILNSNIYPIKKAVDGYIGDMTNPWTKKGKNINLICYSPCKCFAIDCSHDFGNKVFFKSNFTS